MEVAISSALARRLRAEAAASPDAEVCGLLLGRSPARIEAIAPAANLAADPARAFELDPATLFAALRAAREGGPRILGHYHSHPSGRPEPSPRDAAAADGSGALWLILGDGGMRAWRAVAGGPILSAFEEETLLVGPATVAQARRNRHKGVVLGQLKGS